MSHNYANHKNALIDWDKVDVMPTEYELGRKNLFYAQQDQLFKGIAEDEQFVELLKDTVKAKKQKRKKEQDAIKQSQQISI